ncbi:MAG: GC-type dockerin domain-anchored protein, partial [Phycisphaerales bacterium]
VMHSNTTFASYLTTEAGVTCTIGVNMTVRGAGIIDGNQSGGIGGFVNNGAIIADDPEFLLLLTGDHTGSGLFGATDGSALGLGQFADMVDCRFNTLGSGFVSVIDDADLFGGINDGLFIIRSSGSLGFFESFTNNGSITTDPGTTNHEDIFLGEGISILGDGAFVIDNAFGGFNGPSGLPATFGPGQRIEGRADFDGVFVVEGDLAPMGDFDILGELTLTPTSRVDMVVGNSFAADDSELDVDIDAVLSLAGELRVQFADGYTPAANDSFRLVSGEVGTEILGSFDTLTLPTPPPGLLYEINEETYGIYLDIIEDTSVCQADLTGDGVLDFFDVSAFLSAFTAMDPAADFDGNGVFDFFDVSAFLGAFSGGCP